jgi:hypothetical protein
MGAGTGGNSSATATGGSSSNNTGGSGNTTGTGGSNSATGGAAGTTGTGGSATGGNAGTGGASPDASAAGTGGAAQEGGAGGTRDAAPDGPLSVDIASVVPGLDGFLWIGTCADGNASGLDCPIHDNQNLCPTIDPNTAFLQRGAFLTQTMNVMGGAGKVYTVNFEVRGVTGGKSYTGGVLRSTAASVNETNAGTANDGWYIGGTPTDSKWNTYELHVTPAVPAPAARPESLTGPNGATENIYYFNAFSPTVLTQNVPMDARHETVFMGFRASFPVMAGGRLTFVIHDSNCLGQQNCGQTTETQTACSAPRAISLAGMSPQPPSTFVQPYTQSNQFHPQWLFFDVTSVTTP